MKSINQKKEIITTDFLQLNKVTVEPLINTAEKFKGWERRIFMAEVVRVPGSGGQSWAEREPGWNRGAIQKGLQEPESGAVILKG